MRTFCLLTVVALMACVAARHGGHGHGGWGQGGLPQGGLPQGGWGQGGLPQGGWGHGGHGDHDGGHHHEWDNQQTTNICPATNRIIIISDFNHNTNGALDCIGTCNFQSTSALSSIATQTYDMTDSVIIMVSPFGVQNTATSVLSNATLLAQLAAMTNVYLPTVPVNPNITDATFISNIAATNALIQTAAATPGVHLIDTQASFDQNVQSNEHHHLGPSQMCTSMHDLLVAAGVVFPVAAPAAPAVAATTVAPF